MPGFSAKYVKSTELRFVNDFMQRLKLQQMRLKIDLRSNPVTKPLYEDRSIEASARLLEALDRLSLYFCLGSIEDATIEGVPFHSERENVDWLVRPLGDDRILLAPYPFRRDALPVSILARRVPKRLYANELDFQRTLALAPYHALNFTLRAGDEGERARTAVA